MLRFLERELEEGLAAQRAGLYAEEEISAAGGGEELLGALRSKRLERERVEAIQQAGLTELGREELEQVLSEARG